MYKSMYAYIWAHSKRHQIIALLLAVVSFPFLYFSFDLPKTIINKAIKDPGLDDSGFSGITHVPIPEEIVSVEIFGFDFTMLFGIEMARLPYLLLLCFLFLAFVCINGLFKMRINTFKGIMAERLLRRLRYILLERTLRFPLSQFQKTSSGEIVTMVTAEVEPLGGFFGDAFVLPAYQGGTFLTIIVFLFIQDPMMGIAATALVPVQGYIIPKLQKKINLLGKQRVKHVRGLSNQIGEVVRGVQDVHAHDNSAIMLSGMSRQLGYIFQVRLDIFQRKFFMKFINNFINQMTPFLFYAIGGSLVLFGDLTMGALVAALAAYKELAAPWKELLNWYQRLADSRIKYDQLITQFQPPGMLASALQTDHRPERMPRLSGPISANGVSWCDDDGIRVIDGASFSVEPGQVAAILSPSGTVREVFARLMARILIPSSGHLDLGGIEADKMHEAISGSRIGYISEDPTFFSGSIADNLMVGLKRIPPKGELTSAETREDRLAEIEEARASGNSPFNPDSDWIDYESAGVSNKSELLVRATELLDIVDLQDDMYSLGLRLPVDPIMEPELAEHITHARDLVRIILDKRGLDDLVQTYDFDRYNTYDSVADNIIFGLPVSAEWAFENWSSNAIIREMMVKHNLVDDFYDIGLRCAVQMVELFKDLPAGHPFFEQYSFISEDALPELKLMTQKAAQENGASGLSEEERLTIISLPFKLTVQRHRLGLIDEAMQRRLIVLRKDIRESYPEIFKPGGGVAPYDRNSINEGLGILDNILFGRVVHGRADAMEKVSAIVREVARDMLIEAPIIRSALNYQVGIGGARLSSGQRQKLNLIRVLLKRPDILVVSDGLGSLDNEQIDQIFQRLQDLLAGITTVYVGSSLQEGLSFSKILEIRNGRVVEASGIEMSTQIEEGTAHRADTAADPALNSEVRRLQELPLFSNLDATKLKFLVFTSERLVYNPGEILMRQGEDGEAAYVILDGLAEVVIETDGKEQILFELGANKLVGELALLHGSKRTATVRAKDVTTALKLNREVFSEMARQDPHFAFELTRELGRRLILTTGELNKIRHDMLDFGTIQEKQ